MINISNLKFRYKEDSNLVFEDVNIQISSGLWLIDGKNGSGKSTLLDLIKLDDNERMKKGIINEDSIIRRSSNLVFLDDNILIPNRLNEYEFARYIFKINDINMNFDYRPLYTNKPLVSYSTGEKKKVILKILFNLKPDIILLDEYISNLDKDNLDYVINQLSEISKNGTIILVASNEEDIKQRFSNTILIKNKKIELISNE